MREVDVEELARQVLLLREPGSGTRSTALELYEELGITPAAALTLGSNGALRESVQVGLGITLISRDAVARELEEGTLEEWRCPTLPRHRAWHLVSRAGEDLAPTAELFLVPRHRRPGGGLRYGPPPLGQVSSAQDLKMRHTPEEGPGMSTSDLAVAKVAKAMVADGKGILAADESSATITKRFAALDIESTEENRRAYRTTLLGTPNIEDVISGVILYDETIRQKVDDGRSIPEFLASKGILPGIKVDTGSKPLSLCPGEQVTEGLDGLRERIEEYVEPGRQVRQVAGGHHHRHQVRASRATPPSAATPTPWPATAPCARRAGWCRSSSPRC